jgi:anti-sigma-K factor RskA
MRYSSPQLVERLAAEYALGTLHGGARRRFERLLMDRADIRLAVSIWQTRLAPLASSIKPVQPPPTQWQAISERTLARASTQHASSTISWLRPIRWGLGGIAAGLTLSAIAVFTAPSVFISADLIAMRSGERLPQSYVGVLADGQGNGRLLVSSLRHGKTVTLKVLGQGELGTQAAPLQLWALPPPDVNSGKAFLLAQVPVKGSGQAMLAQTSEQLLAKISKLVVTRINAAEPSTPGEIVLTGHCAKLW